MNHERKQIVNRNTTEKKKSIFQALFVPLIILMILQSALFYFAAVYGGVESYLNQNAADILSERLNNRKNEIETSFNQSWSNLQEYEEQFSELYCDYQDKYGESPFVGSKENQLNYLSESTDLLIRMLRLNRTNGVFLLLNDQSEESDSLALNQKKNGIGVRDLDATSIYTNREDLLLERAPGSLVQETGCSLDAWWEAYYLFTEEEKGAFFYKPLQAAWQNPDVESGDLAYFDGAHHLTKNDNEVVSYSIPLKDKNGYPYGVLGVELTTKYLTALMPNQELGNAEKTCYILGMQERGSTDITPIIASGSIYKSALGHLDTISIAEKEVTGGFNIKGKNQKEYYGNTTSFEIYNNNSPFDDQQLVLVAVQDKATLFAYSAKVKQTLLLVALISLTIGIIGIFVVSRRFAAPITALSKKARDMKPQPNFTLEHLGITEIDQLVDSIESLNENVSREIARTEFFSRMSHDMRTPMNAIISFSSKEMLEDINEKEKDDYLKKIHSSGNYLLGLINEVLDMTKIESNMVDLHVQPVAAEDLTNTIISMIEKLAEKKRVHFERRIEIQENLWVQADTQHIEQIILNLLSNAVKFTPEGGTVLFQMIFEQRQSEDIACHIMVEDNGMGMSKEFMSKLYTPFEQEHPGNGGTGLGLSISKKLTELMGGTIQCQSVQNVGTTFRVELPLKSVESDIPLQSMDVSSMTTMQLEKSKIRYEKLRDKRVLLCEDHPLNRQIAVTLLSKREMIVDTAEDGAQGVQKFSESEEGTYDAILMDIRMPNMDGLEATTAIRALSRTDAQKIPIIAMTANAFLEDVAKSQEAGMNAHLSKPIEPDKLFGTLLQLIK